MAARIEWRDKAVRDRALYGPMVIVEEGPWCGTENQESVARLIIRYDAGGGEGANRRRDGCRVDESVTGSHPELGTGSQLPGSHPELGTGSQLPGIHSELGTTTSGVGMAAGRGIEVYRAGLSCVWGSAWGSYGVETID